MSWDLPRALAYLDEHINLEAFVAGHADVPTLERMARLCQLLGDPQHAQPVVHLTGTNGKGSTARITSALLGAHNLAVGTYTSPDLERVNERISRNGEPIDDAALAEAIETVSELEDASGIRPSWFEIMTLAAFRWFADVAVDVAVLEVGLAGRWDATNVADADVAVVTNVGLDHTEVLGPTRADIAREKAGIVKPGSILVLGETDPELVSIFESAGPAEVWRRGRDFDCTSNRVAVGGRVLDLTTPSGSYSDVFLPLHGAHQGDNAAAALAAAEAFFARPVDDDVVREAFAAVKVPGRFEIVGRSPLVVLDGAHNPDGARVAASTLHDFNPGGERILVVGMNKGRDVEEMLEALDARSARVVVACSADSARALPAADVAAVARRMGLDAEIVPDVAEAVARARGLAVEEDLILVTGSLYVVGDARSALAGGGGESGRRR